MSSEIEKLRREFNIERAIGQRQIDALSDALRLIVDEFERWEKRTRLPKGRKHFPVSMLAGLRVGTLRRARYVLKTGSSQ